MTAQIVMLHEGRRRVSRRHPPEQARNRQQPLPVHCKPLPNDHVAVARDLLKLPLGLGDDAITQSLCDIAKANNDDERWRAAFHSTIGLYLALRADDFNGAMSDLIALASGPNR